MEQPEKLPPKPEAGDLDSLKAAIEKSRMEGISQKKLDETAAADTQTIDDLVALSDNPSPDNIAKFEREHSDEQTSLS